jgi:hypothetical protein
MNNENNFHRNNGSHSNNSGRSLGWSTRPLTKTTSGALSKDLILCRGLPGSGKTTIASVFTMIGYRHFEADMYFEVDGIYTYDATRIRDAHDWCKRMTRDALQRGANVVVSNTFTRLTEMAPYHEMGASNIRIIEASGHWENRHAVPVEMVQRMAARWEQLPGMGGGA